MSCVLVHMVYDVDMGKRYWRSANTTLVFIQDLLVERATASSHSNKSLHQRYSDNLPRRNQVWGMNPKSPTGAVLFLETACTILTSSTCILTFQQITEASRRPALLKLQTVTRSRSDSEPPNSNTNSSIYWALATADNVFLSLGSRYPNPTTHCWKYVQTWCYNHQGC